MSLPGIRAAATRSGAAEEKSPGTTTSPSLSAPAGWTVTLFAVRRICAPAAWSMSSVWSRVGTRLDHGRRARRVEAGEEDRGLHLRARDFRLELGAAQRAGAADDERRVAVGRLHVGAHAAQRLGDPLHRARR